MFTFATVKEYMFDGYSVQHYLNFLRSPAITLIGGVKIPGSIATGRFGFYYGVQIPTYFLILVPILYINSFAKISKCKLKLVFDITLIEK